MMMTPVTDATEVSKADADTDIMWAKSSSTQEFEVLGLVYNTFEVEKEIMLEYICQSMDHSEN